MSNNNNSRAVPPQPDEKFDLQIDPDSFPVIESLLRTYPDICKITARRRRQPSYLFNRPDLIRRVLIDNHKNYRKGIGFERAKLLLGNGIIVSDGDTWKRQRRMVQPAFHADMLKKLSATIAWISRQWLDRWSRLARDGRSFDLSRSASEFALEVMLRSLFGDDLDAMIQQAGGENPFAIFTEDSQRDLNLARRFRMVTRLIQERIDHRRRRSAQPDDMLAALMAARDRDDRPMSDKALMDEIMTLIVAGHETSAITLTWMWYLLSQHPAVENRLHEEVDAADTEQTLPYCRQVMHETLRLYPPVWLFSRRAVADDEAGGYGIPAGADIFIAPYFLHRRPDLWPRPERFQPERFDGRLEGRQHRIDYIPFSAGPRRCIGDAFAMLEIQIHMRTIARRIRLRDVPQGPIELEPAINLRSRHPIEMIPEFRRQ